MIKLRNCPFCCGEATAWTRGGRYGLFAWVERDICGAQTKSASTTISADDPAFIETQAFRKIAANWNRRDTSAE